MPSGPCNTPVSASGIPLCVFDCSTCAVGHMHLVNSRRQMSYAGCRGRGARGEGGLKGGEDQVAWPC